MAKTFDPYHKWLGIPAEDQPPHYYRLLGIPLFEEDPQVIEAAANRQMKYLRDLQTDVHAQQAKTLLNEVSRARVCLLKPDSKARYDSQLRETLDQQGATQPNEMPSSADVANGGAGFIVGSPIPGIDLDDYRPLKRSPWKHPGAIVATILLIALGGGVAVFLTIPPSKPAPQAAGTKGGKPGETAEQDREERVAKSDSHTPRSTDKEPARSLSKNKKAPWNTFVGGDEPSEGILDNAPQLNKENLTWKIDLTRDVVKGSWTREQDVLVTGSGRFDRVQIPGEVPAAYNLKIVAEKISATGYGLMVHLPVGKNSVLAVLDGWNGETNGLDLVGGVAGDLNETMTIGSFTQQGLNTFIYRVQPNQIQVEANGKKVFTWRGDSSTLSVHPDYRLPRSDELGLAVFGTEWRVHGVTLAAKPVTSVPPGPVLAGPAREPAGFQVPVISPAENLISKIDPVRDAVQGTWKIEQDVLIAPSVQRDRIRIPVKVPPVYTVTMLAERTEMQGDGLLMVLPVGKGQVLACVDCWDGRFSGLETINEVQGNSNESTTFARLLKPGVNTFVYDVTPESVRVEVNGRKAIDWTGDSNSLSLHPFYKMPDKQDLGIAGGRVEWRIRGIKLESPKSNSAPQTQVAQAKNFADAPQGALIIEKKPVPDAAAQEAAKKTVRDLFKTEYAQAKKQEGKIALANALFKRGPEVDDDSPACYVMLSEAADLAAEAGQLGLSWDAIVALTDRFQVDRLPLMEQAARTAAPYAKTFDEVHTLTEMCANLTQEAIRVNDFESANKLMQGASGAVRKPLFVNLKEPVAAQAKRVAVLREAFEAVKSARKTLQEQATDPLASLIWGRFLCYHKNNWTDGLALMALGVDPILSPLAQRELALSDKSQVPDANVYAKLGDDWWALAEKEKEPVRSVIRDHAAEYYLLAQGGATGLDKAALQQKVERSFGAAKFLDAPGNENGVVIAPSELNPGTAFTLEFWMATQAATGTIVSKRHQEEGESSIVVRMNEGVPELGTNADYHWDAAGGKSKINDGAWHHLAVVRLGRQVYLYIDGKKECQVESLNTYSSKSPWKAGVARGQDSMALRLCRLRVSGTPRYLLPFVPDKQYGKDAATIYPK